MAASCQNEHSKHGPELPDLARAAAVGPAGCDGPSEGHQGYHGVRVQTMGQCQLKQEHLRCRYSTAELM